MAQTFESIMNYPVMDAEGAKKALEEHYDMAVMSKELALICLDCPIDFSWDEARLTNLYTPEAY